MFHSIHLILSYIPIRVLQFNNLSYKQLRFGNSSYVAVYLYGCYVFPNRIPILKKGLTLLTQTYAKKNSVYGQ